MDKPKIQVDFNELVQKDLVLLSKSDEIQDSEGNLQIQQEGMHVSVYEYNQYDDGEKEYLLAEGVVELNDSTLNQ